MRAYVHFNNIPLNATWNEKLFRKNVCTENQNTTFRYNLFFFPEKRASYEIIWKNIVQSGRTRLTIWRMRFAYWNN